MKVQYLASVFALTWSFMAPTSASPASLISRQAANSFLAIFESISKRIGDTNAYDFEKLRDFCAVRTWTYGGGHCYASVECQSGGLKEFTEDQWKACHLGGRNYFKDDRIGEFSVTFSEGGGQNGNTEDGLHHPII
ncbi:MAG: hypothetical protein M1833_004694 [Piccolia ochrophora]|nr:MAG: hypothetical protein M1833_004694 [Piccolia ochrophora]